MYELRFMPPARKYFKKLKEKSLITAYSHALEQISQDPYQGEAKVGNLVGIYCMDVYHSKTNYEIAYRIIENGGVGVVFEVLALLSDEYVIETKGGNT